MNGCDGLGFLQQVPTARLVGDIHFEVIENGVIVNCGGRRTYFADATAATAHIAGFLEERKIEARHERERGDAERKKWEERRADPLGGLGSPETLEKLIGVAAQLTGLDKGALQEMLREKLGVDSWRAGEPPVN